MAATVAPVLAQQAPRAAVGGEWAIPLPFMVVSEIPSLNDREHWALKAKKVKAWREAGNVLARSARVPACNRIQVELFYVPATAQRRDPDNLVAALKPLVDGLVDAGVVPDDTERYVERMFPRILESRKTLPPGRKRFTLVITSI